MMIGFIKKDMYYLLTSWKLNVLSILIVGAFLGYQHMGVILIILLPTFFALSILGCIQNDAQKKWYHVNRILPISIKQIVSSRYIAFLIYITIGIFIVWIYAVLLQSIYGLELIGKSFEIWQGLCIGASIALGFGTCFLPATYYYHGERMEIAMMLSSLIAFGVFLGIMKVLPFLGISLQDYKDICIQLLCITSCIAFFFSWIISIIIYQKRRFILH